MSLRSSPVCVPPWLYEGEPGFKDQAETGVMRPVGEDVSEQCVQARPGHWQHCAFEPVKRGDVSRATRIGKIVKMLDEHPDDFKGVLHRNRSRAVGRRVEL